MRLLFLSTIDFSNAIYFYCCYIYSVLFVHISYNIIKKGSDIMANTNSSNISIRMDADLKAAAEALYEELGMNLSTAFNIFVRQSLRVGGIPFTITTETPNAITVSAMLEAQRIAKNPDAKAYDNLNDLFKELKTE